MHHLPKKDQMRSRLPFALTALAFVAASGGLTACPIERATYVYSTDRHVTATFADLGVVKGWMSPLALGVHLGPSKASYWFLFDHGSARRTALISTTDVHAAGWRPPAPDGGVRPLGETSYLSWDGDRRVRQAIPLPGDRAPRFLLLPELEELLWYRATPRVGLAQGLFTYAACRQ
ncbi:hypothetical protein [Luteibacter sahnii]|uniref:hypothetical protein n=1 Tax=Luteibacter sahnii TaxID=3021977 RepID=UPI002A6A6BC4|nr:hypothetical protein [Luteibacter sp. PPL193]MDY1547063.1 hypothetical protein [Luteibacter sp. PPL193]